MMHQKVMQGLARYAHLQKPDDFLVKSTNEMAEKFHDNILSAHSTLCFSSAEQFTLYLKPNAVIKDIVQLISEIEDFLAANNIAPSKTPEFECPLTTYFSFRKEPVNGE